ncbi:MAG: site-specific integrase [Duncaniella sp.]|nr:site-specific integrase [Duncaniella sp.]
MKKIHIRRRNDLKNNEGLAPIYAVLSINGAKERVPLRLYATKKEWSDTSECFLGRDKASKDKNLIIEHERAKIAEVLVQFRLSGEALTKEKFRAALKSPGRNTNFNTYARQRLEAIRAALRPGTCRHHAAVLRKVAKYNPVLPIEEITFDWLRLYIAHLRSQYNNNNSTIRKNVCVIRAYYYAAMREGKVKHNPFENFHLPPAEPAIVYLTEEELQKLTALYKKQTLTDSEQRVLRFFLFMTFTAMHISDARALQIEQIQDKEIHYRRLKTGTRVEMPLSAPAVALVEFYRGGRLRGNLFKNLPTDQVFNRIIKSICAKVGIFKPISAKAARHTFATLYYKKNSGDLGTLSKLLGHTSINTTMIYAHIMKEDRIAGVAAFDDML